MNAIQIKNLTKVYKNGTRALHDVGLEVPRGDFFALLGANGAGKTTMIGILTGLLNKTAGKVQVFGFDLEQQADRARRLIGVVPQEFNFNMFEKVMDIVVTQAGYFGIERKKAMDLAEVLLKQMGLWEKRDVQSRTLSGGMKRRLMIVRGLIHNPKLLILDEPTAGVDVELRHSMWEFLRGLNKSGVTILLTTHYLEEVEQMCRHAAIIKEGEIIRNDSVSRLVRFVENETYVIAVKTVQSIGQLSHYEPKIIDEHTFEVELSSAESLNDLILQISNAGMTVTDIRPKGNRLEKLFLNILKK